MSAVYPSKTQPSLSAVFFLASFVTLPAQKISGGFSHYARSIWAGKLARALFRFASLGSW